MLKIKSKKLMGLVIAVLVTTASFSFTGDNHFITVPPDPSQLPVERKTTEPVSLFTELNLGESGLAEETFNYAVKGLNNLKSAGKVQNDSIISIIDFTKASDKKRLFVIDLHHGKVLFNTYVSHGRNSGLSSANEFSNERNSFKSSLGFYVTENTYKGKHGYSLKLKGEEDGFNDNAEERGIIMHAANYVNEAIIKARGYIGRSEGCPAIPQKVHKAIISTIKEGSCLFVYSPDPYYLKHSQLLNTN